MKGIWGYYLLGKFRLYHLVFLVAFFLATYISVLLMALNSESYEVGLSFVKSDVEISRQVGPVSNVDLDFWGEFYLEGERAFYQYKVYGADGEVVVGVQLARSLGVWKVSKFDMERASEPIKN